MALDATTIRRINSYISATQGTTDRVLRFVEAQIRAMSNMRDSNVDALVRRILPVIEGGQFQIATLTDSYLALLESQITESTVRPLGIARRFTTTEALRGVAGSEVYSRIGLSVYRSLSLGNSFEFAKGAGLFRGLELASTGLQLANTHTARRVIENKDNVVGYRRVLTGGESCRLCATASTQRYNKANLMPIHPRCDCKIAPIYGENDPGQVINSDFLREIKQSDTQVVVHEHGEIGPMLAIKGQHFTSESDID